MSFPRRIVCLTEESVEFLYDLGREDLIAGVSTFVRRPIAARRKPILSAFTHANIKKIIGTDADLVIGFSDIQKNIARDLIAEGVNVFISNHRSLEQTLDYLLMLSRIVGEEKKGKKVVEGYRNQLSFYQQRGLERKQRPRVYLEEWDEPLIRGIQWFREAVQICGGIDIFEDQAPGPLASQRLVKWNDVVTKNADIILASWCGKPVDKKNFSQRERSDEVLAVKENHIYELPSEVILQPGPALFKDAFQMIDEIFTKWEEKKVTP